MDPVHKTQTTSQNGLKAPVPTPSASQGKGSKAHVAATEILLMQEQLKLVKEYQGDILATVHWALGGVFIALVAVTGLNWFTAFNSAEKERRQLLDSVESRLDKFDAQFSERQSSSLQRSEKSNEERLELLAGKLDAELNQLRSSFEDAQAHLEKIDKSLYWKDVELRHVEEVVWKIKGSPRNVLITQGQSILAAVLSKDESLVEATMNRMKETINEEFLSSDVKLDKEAYKMIEPDLSSAVKLRPILVAELQKLLHDITDHTPSRLGSDA